MFGFNAVFSPLAYRYLLFPHTVKKEKKLESIYAAYTNIMNYTGGLYMHV